MMDVYGELVTKVAVRGFLLVPENWKWLSSDNWRSERRRMRFTVDAILFRLFRRLFLVYIYSLAEAFSSLKPWTCKHRPRESPLS